MSERKQKEDLICGLTDADLDAVVLIVGEVFRARKKHPEWPDDPVRSAAIVCEESGELIRAALQYDYEDGLNSAMENEAIETGAMAIRFLTGL